MKTRTIIAFTMILLMLISMFAGCGQKPAPVSSSTPAASTGTSAAPAATANPKPYEGKTLRFVTPNQPCIESTVQNSLNEFKEKTGITVEMEILATDQFTNKVTVELSSQTKSLDMFFLRPLNDMKLFNQNQWLTDLTPYLDAEDLKDYYEGSIDSCTRDGKLYGIPIVAESHIVYYRKDIFEKNGIAKFPETMEELYNVAKKLTDKKNEFYGYVGRGKSNQVVTQFSTYLRSFGGLPAQRFTLQAQIQPGEASLQIIDVRGLGHHLCLNIFCSLNHGKNRVHFLCKSPTLFLASSSRRR
jgi:multiple sugar transport system substrate-binding protein